MWEYFGLLGHQGGLTLGYPPPPSTGRPSNQKIYDAEKRKMTNKLSKGFFR